MVKTEANRACVTSKGAAASTSQLPSENAGLELPDLLVWSKEKRNLDVYMEFLNF